MVEYDSKTYERDSRGKYRCPNRCGHPDYPQPSWVTDKGFLKHLAECEAKVWTPEPVQENAWFCDCPDCGLPIWTLTSCWWMHDKIVCLDCYLPYFEAGVGHIDGAGLELPIFALDG